MTKQRIISIVVKMVIAALTAFITALGTTSCMSAVGMI
ncbi:MAG: smalltalk protein [Prevotella sp.]|nr:smalltalk protein [Prevotella sp.]